MHRLSATPPAPKRAGLSILCGFLAAVRFPGPRSMARAAGRRTAGWVASLFSLAAAPALAVGIHQLTLDLRDSSGVLIDARVSAHADSFSVWFPIARDTVCMAHAGYSYPPAGSSLSLLDGWTTLSVSRGPEWVPDTRRFYLARDTSVTVRLQRFLDMRARGFFCSDLHVHSRHAPIEFNVSPENTLRIARAEDLAILHLLDQEFRFTGAVDVLSDANTLLYHSFEYRHMTYGHVVLPGLRQAVDWGCCLAPAEAWPTLGQLANQVAGPNGALFVLAHPATTNDYDEDTHWPGTGLGREYPVLAALGRLDGFEVASYSNESQACWQDWYDGLSSGLALTPTAGTDAVLNAFSTLPAGGWRMYADLGAHARLDYDAWLAAVRAGRTFVTSLPLLPRFQVAGSAPGSALEAAADTTDFPVSLEAACVTGLARVRLVSDRGTLWSLDLSRRSPPATRLDTTFTLRTATPCWIALRADGVAGDRALLGLPAVAHTNAVRLLKNGAPRRDGVACGRMLDRLDALEQRLGARRGWTTSAHVDSVYGAIRRARAVYAQVFKDAPAAFQLIPPPAAGTPRLRWTPAADREPGDRVRYRITLAADSTFRQPTVFYCDTSYTESVPVRAGLPNWWRIEAVDRAGNVTRCDPPAFLATLLVASAAVGEGPATARPRSWPNPAHGPVRLQGLGPDAMILDVAGRRVATRGDGLRLDGLAWVWDVREHGRRAHPGLYWAVSRSRGVSLPITILD